MTRVRNKDTDWLRQYVAASRPSRQPQLICGEMFACVHDTALAVGFTETWLHRLVAHCDGQGRPIVTLTGIRFVRLSRHDGDERAPVYFDVDSVRRYMEGRK